MMTVGEKLKALRMIQAETAKDVMDSSLSIEARRDCMKMFSKVNAALLALHGEQLDTIIQDVPGPSW